MSTNNLRPFLYTVPNSAISLIVYDEEKMPKDMEIMLWHGTVVEMPEDHEAVQVLVHQGYLQPVAKTEAVNAEVPAEVVEVQPVATASKPKGKA